MNNNIVTAPPEIKIPDAITRRRLDEYAKRHYLTEDANKLVSFLYMNGPCGSSKIMEATELIHDRFFAALCVASGVLILCKRAITVDVCLTSRKAIASIPESALTPKPEPAAMMAKAVTVAEITETIAEEEVAEAVAFATTNPG